MNATMPNQILVIKPYWHLGTWVFDDPSTDLVQEPFVSGVPEMINDLVADIPNARQGFRLLFSSAPFPVFSGSWSGFERSLTATGIGQMSHRWKAGCVRHCFFTLKRHQQSCM